MSRRTTAAVLVPLALVLIAGVSRFVLLSHPDRIIFDETYYVNDAKNYLDMAVEDGFAVHPPVGKWIIAAGIEVFGDNPFGWRVMGALAGTLMVLLVYLIGIRLFRWRGAAALAALLAIVDGLLFVQARTSMLDIFLGLFVVLGAWLLLVDFDRSGLSEPERAPPGNRGDDAAHDDQLALPVPAGGSGDESPDDDWLGDERLEPEPESASEGPLFSSRSSASPDADADADANIGAHAGADTDDSDENAERASDDEESDGTFADPLRPGAENVPGTRRRGGHLPARGHPYRLLAGVAFGLAAATKWSGLLALGAAGLVVIGYELAWRRRITGAAFTGFWGAIRSIGVTLVAIPVVVYFLSYTPWLVNYPHTSEGKKVCEEDGEVIDPCHVSLPGRLAGLARYQEAIWDFHLDLEADHPYRAAAYTWLYLGRPVVYYWENCSGDRAAGVTTTNDEGEEEAPEPCVVAEGNAAEIINLGNPALWVFAGLSLVPLGFGLFNGDRRAWYLFIFWGGQFVPWLIVSRPAFFFYMTPIVPFMTLFVAYGVTWIDERGVRRARERDRALARTGATGGAITGAVIALIAVGLFLYFYPVYTGLEFDEDVIRQRWWVDTWI